MQMPRFAAGSARPRFVFAGTHLRARLIVGALLVSAPLLGCRDQAKVSAQQAQEDAASLAVVAEKDIAEVEQGMPEGAKKLGLLWSQGKNPHDDLAGVRAALGRTRREVHALNLSKSTFFALADDHGVAIRNDLEQDAMAEKNLFSIFPDLGKVKDGPVSTHGAFPETAAQSPPDRDWIYAVPVQGEDHKMLGVYVTGWTYRRFAFHLQETLRHELSEKLRKEQAAGKLPIFYVLVFDSSGVYGAPHTPDVNEKALAAAGLVEKTASGPHQSTLEITGRDFGYGAVRVPKLAPDAGIAVLRSEI